MVNNSLAYRPVFIKIYKYYFGGERDVVTTGLPRTCHIFQKGSNGVKCRIIIINFRADLLRRALFGWEKAGRRYSEELPCRLSLA